jgi:hypothetical protein
LTCKVGLLSGVGKWAVLSLQHPQIHDPGIQHEPVKKSQATMSLT